MTPKVVLIADDLTGALDAGAPFAIHGLRTVVALRPEAIPAALHTGADVVCVSTASRELPAGEAAARVRAAAQALRGTGAAIQFKKIDSRLKGPVAAEIAAALDGFGHSEAVVAPAIPELGRFVRDGHVVGAGVDKPILVRSRVGQGHVVPDTADDAEMDGVVQDLLNGAPRLAVGARGLSLALARALGRPVVTQSVVPLAQPLLLAIGSRDLITRRQLGQLYQAAPVQLLEAPNGWLDTAPAPAAITVLVTAEQGPPEPVDVVAQRFAEAIARSVQAIRPATVLMSGGETAQAALAVLQIDLLEIGGEAMTGIPYCWAMIDGRNTLVLTKSGGFGGPETIAALAGVAAKTIMYAES